MTITFPKPDVEQFFQTLAVSNFTVSPDETHLVLSTNINGQFNLWGIDLPNTFPYPLTFKNQAASALSYAQTGDYIIASFDHDGDENHQIYALSPQGGALVDLVVNPGERHYYSTSSEDGKRIYYVTSTDNSEFLNTCVYNLDTKTSTTLLSGEGAPSYLYTVSPEEDSFVYSKQFGNTHSLLFIHKDNTSTLLTPATDAQHTTSSPKYVSNDEIYFVTNYEADLSYLAKYTISTGEFKKVLAIDKEDFDSVSYSKSEHVLYIGGGFGVEDRIYRYDLATEEYSTLPLPTSVVEKLVVAKSGNLYIMGRSATRPSNLYVSKNSGQSWEALTSFRIPGVKEEDLVEPEVIHYNSFDGLEIEALFFKAHKALSNGHVILWPHGGPQSLERKWFRAMFQVLLNRGYSIFAPNFRGSSNYGLAFSKMVEGDWGHGPRLDNMEGVKWLIDNGYVAADKVFVLGGSYGGYMSLLLHGRHADTFKAVVDIFGPSNLFSFINSVPPHWKSYMDQWVGNPERDKERLTLDSPITHLDGMTKPMLVIQGANDPRVVKAESDQIVAALEEKGRDVQYIVLDDEGHGFSKKKNEILVYEEIIAFLDKHLS
jgi:dipeptidyl aminopeptidase/acylaminoacyl peptidase